MLLVRVKSMEIGEVLESSYGLMETRSNEISYDVNGTKLDVKSIERFDKLSNSKLEVDGTVTKISEAANDSQDKMADVEDKEIPSIVKEKFDENVEQSLTTANPVDTKEQYALNVTQEGLQNIEDSFMVGRSIKTKVLSRINYGSYGSIHLGIFQNTGEKVAVKLENLHNAHPQLLAEGATLRHLENGPGIPTIMWFGSHEPRFNVMVMDLLGPNLQQLLTFCGHKFSLKTVLMLADQMLETLDFVHSKEYIHRDIKPDNFAIGQLGTDRESRIYLLDFGLSKKFHRHQFLMSFSSSSMLTPPLAGTVRYMGVHAHDGQNDQPRDDLESLGYVFIYFLKGHLPWQGIEGCGNREEKLAVIRKMKVSLDLEELCSDLPKQFSVFLERCRRARVHNAETTAKNWQKFFQYLALEQNAKYDGRFDWVVKREETGEDMSEVMKSRGHNSS